MNRLAPVTRSLSRLLAVLCLLACLPLQVWAGDATALDLNGVHYVHRWSKNGQNEFTPPAEPDLNHWTDMLTINVVEKITDGEQLAVLANKVLGGYQAAGKVLRANSVARTESRPAEHFIGAVLGKPGFLEAVFARFVLVDGIGMVIVQSHRLYGPAVGPDMAAWLQANGARNEQALMAWRGMPAAASLRALPQSTQ